MDPSCTGKMGYLTWDLAKRAMSRGRFRNDPREGFMSPYRCRRCGFFHIGKSAFSQKAR